MLYHFGNNIENARLNLAKDGRFRVLFQGRNGLGDVYTSQVTLSRLLQLLRMLGFTQELTQDASITILPPGMPKRWSKAPELCLRSTIPALFKKYGYQCTVDYKLSGWEIFFSPEHEEFLRVACVKYRLA